MDIKKALRIVLDLAKDNALTVEDADYDQVGIAIEQENAINEVENLFNL
jgi:hypothetical protein